MAERKIGRREPLVEHEINEHAGNGNVEPDRHSPSAETPMPIPAAPKNGHEGNDNQRQGDKGEQNVRDQDWKIDPCDQPAVSGRFFAGVQVVDDVADQKSAGSDEGDDHAGDMALPDVAPYPKPARGNENGADCIKGCVDGGQVVYCHVERSRDISCGNNKKLTRSPPDSLAATLTAQPSMSVVPFTPFLDFPRNDKLG